MTTDTGHSPEPFQYVAVPQQHVAAVYRLLADLTDAGSAAGGEDTSPSFGIDGWTEDKLRRFAAGDTKTTQLVAEIMDVLAQTPDQPLTLDELAELTGRPHSQIKTLWTHASRHFAKHYGTSKSPVTKKWGDQLSPQRENVVYYFLTADQVEMWERVRQA